MQDRRLITRSVACLYICNEQPKMCQLSTVALIIPKQNPEGMSFKSQQLLMPLNCTLKMVKVVNTTIYICVYRYVCIHIHIYHNKTICICERACTPFGACLQVRGRPWVLILTFHPVWDRIPLVHHLFTKLAGLGASGDSPVSTSSVPVGVQCGDRCLSYFVQP